MIQQRKEEAMAKKKLQIELHATKKVDGNVEHAKEKAKYWNIKEIVVNFK